MTGLLVAPGDAAALAQTLDTLRRDRLAEMGGMGGMGGMGRKRFLEKFRIEECEARLASLYHELVDGDRGVIRH